MSKDYKEKESNQNSLFTDSEIKKDFEDSLLHDQDERERL